MIAQTSMENVQDKQQEPTQMDDPLQREVSLKVLLPGGLERDATVHGSKPVMDFLVTLCASNHLNPADHTVEILSPNRKRLSFKANAPIGLLDARKIILKPKGGEEKTRQPYKPEVTVRLLINYNTSHKTVLRVNPRLPLEALLPMVCEKCEFDLDSTILLRDVHSTETLDLTRTLDELGLREVFAADHKAQTTRTDVTPTEVRPAPVDQQKKQSQRGFLSLFWRTKKKHPVGAPPSSPGHLSPAQRTSNTLQGDIHKKRRAPPPPTRAHLNHRNHTESLQNSATSLSRSTKRKAPLPPPLAPSSCTNSLQDLKEDVDLAACLKTLDELVESSSLYPSHPSSPSPPHFQTPDPRLPSYRRKDFSDARSALAKVLTSSVSKGALAKRLRNTAAFPKFHVSSCVSMTPECLDKGLHSAVRSNIPARSHWEEKTVINKFRDGSCDPDLIADVPEQYQISLGENPERKTFPDQTDRKDDCSAENNTEEKRDIEEVTFPPPPPPVFYEENSIQTFFQNSSPPTDCPANLGPCTTSDAS